MLHVNELCELWFSDLFMYVRECVCGNVQCTYTCMYMYVCVHVCVRACAYACVCVCAHAQALNHYSIYMSILSVPHMQSYNC